MTAGNAQIVQLYEESGMTPEQIAASDLGFDLLSIKAVLLQNSSLYRDAVRSAKGDKSLEDAFSKEDQIAARDVIARIALYGDENPELQFRAAKYVRDDAKGRLDIAAGISSLNINVALFQQQLDKSKRARELTLAKAKSIDVPSSITTGAVEQKPQETNIAYVDKARHNIDEELIAI